MNTSGSEDAEIGPQPAAVQELLDKPLIIHHQAQFVTWLARLADLKLHITKRKDISNANGFFVQSSDRKVLAELSGNEIRAV